MCARVWWHWAAYALQDKPKLVTAGETTAILPLTTQIGYPEPVRPPVESHDAARAVILSRLGGAESIKQSSIG